MTRKYKITATNKEKEETSELVPLDRCLTVKLAGKSNH
jgi:hypothetical protein